MDKAKLRLSEKEALLVTNADWILTKNEILQKVMYLLAGVQTNQHQFIDANPLLLPAEVMAIKAKISRGENYKGLPYLILDFPRYFGREDQFAIRTMFWWGNFFSITLHLSGVYKDQYVSRIETAFDSLRNESYFIGVSDDPWEHHFENSNYLPLDEMNENEFSTTARNKPFIKLAKRISLDQWDDAVEVLSGSFINMIGWLNA